MFLVELIRFLAMLGISGAVLIVLKSWLASNGYDKAVASLSAIYN